MADHLSKEQRSRNMSRIRSKDSAAEKAVRSILHRLGCRFRLHRRDLPGTPDIVLPKYRTALFVHGCFWHRHQGCKRSFVPSTRTEYWSRKFQANVERDRRNRADLMDMGWQVVVLWECETKDTTALTAHIKSLISHEFSEPFEQPTLPMAAEEAAEYRIERTRSASVVSGGIDETGTDPSAAVGTAAERDNESSTE